MKIKFVLLTGLQARSKRELTPLLVIIDGWKELVYQYFLVEFVCRKSTQLWNEPHVPTSTVELLVSFLSVSGL